MSKHTPLTIYDMKMHDYNMLRRRQWLRRLGRSWTRNAFGIDREELAHWVSERLALIIVATLIVLVVWSATQW